MRRNFELLKQAKKEQGLLRTSCRSTMPTNGRDSRTKLQMLSRQEEIKLVQRVFLLLGPVAPRIVLFTGVEHGNGCSRICARTGETLATQVMGSVCLVDANLRSPSLHQYFGVHNLAGLAESVVQTDPIQNFLQQLPISGGNLSLLTCGFHALDPHPLLGSDRLRLRFSELRAQFDYVLIDAPPANLYPDASLLGQMADGVILVIEANSTRRERALKAKESLENTNVRLIGAVLNKRTFPIPEAVYSRL